MPLPRVFLDFTVGDAPLGRVVLELFADVVPKTAENFRALATGETGKSYRGSPVHRVIEGFMIQGGDFTKRNGTGGESIYGATFKDERLSGPGTAVDKEGLLVMANRGPDTNSSQWFITLAAAPHLTGKHVVFGRVVSGMEHIHTIGRLPTDGRDRPHSPVVIVNSGELELRRPAAPVPARSRSRSASVSSDSEEERRRRRRERRERKDREREERREERRKRRKARRDSDSEDDKKRSDSRSRSPRRRERSTSETLSELDARLEREERAQLEEEKRQKLLDLKSEMERERQAIKDSGGVVYKGRGTMRYRDPESRPANYAARGPDARPRYRDNRDRDDGRWERDAGRGGRGDRDTGRWERDRAPAFERGKDMDRWDHGGFRGDRSDQRDRDRQLDIRGSGGERDEDASRSLASRFAPSALPYDDDLREREKERERERDGGDGGREARAGAWKAARRSVSPPSPPRSRSPVQSPAASVSPGPRRERSVSLDRRSDGSDMVMDD